MWRRAATVLAPRRLLCSGSAGVRARVLRIAQQQPSGAENLSADMSTKFEVLCATCTLSQPSHAQNNSAFYSRDH